MWSILLGLVIIASVLIWLWWQVQNEKRRTRLSEFIPTDIEMKAWQENRLKVWSRAEGVCEVCGFPLPRVESHIPHFEVYPIDGDSGNYESQNLILVCRSCNGLTARWQVGFDIPYPCKDKGARALARLYRLVDLMPYDQVCNVFEEWTARKIVPTTFEMACRLAELGIRGEERRDIARNLANLRKRRTDVARR